MDTSKLKPFNLERALAGDPVVTRDGFSVIEIIKLKSNITAPVLCVVEGTNWTAKSKSRLLKNKSQESFI